MEVRLSRMREWWRRMWRKDRICKVETQDKVRRRGMPERKRKEVKEVE